MPISLLSFPFLTDLDQGLLKNSGTLSGQIPWNPSMIQWAPIQFIGKKLELRHLWSLQLCFFSQHVTGEKLIFHYVFIINFYFNCIIVKPLKLWIFDLWTIVQSVFVNIPRVMWKMYILQSCYRSMCMPCIKCFIRAAQICIPYWFFCLLLLFITDMSVLEYFIVIIDLSI